MSNVCSLYQAVIGPKRVHRYPTKENRPQLAMDQVQKELADMRERMDQFMTLMTGMAAGQEKLTELVGQPRPEVEILNAEGNPGNPGNADNPVNTGNAGNANADGNPGNVGNTGNVGNGIGGRYNVNQGIRINGHPNTEDCQYDQFSLHDEALETTRRMDELAEKLKSLESQNSLGFDVTNLGLVQGVRIPHKFKPPTFEKYNGASCPRTHLQSYLGRLGAHTEDEKLWMYYFEDSLTGALVNGILICLVLPSRAGKTWQRLLSSNINTTWTWLRIGPYCKECLRLPRRPLENMLSVGDKLLRPSNPLCLKGRWRTCS